jgi:nicotinamidase-related amidase
VFHPRRAAIIVIDLQKAILQLPGDPHLTAAVIANCVRLVKTGA